MSTAPIEHPGPASAPGRPGGSVWPGLATPPRSPIRARIGERLFRRAVAALPVRVLLPGGKRLGAGGPDAPVMRLVRPAAFFHRLGSDALIGFGESYMVGDWTADAPAELLTPFAARMGTLVPPRLQTLRRWAERRRPAREENTIDGARENVQRHYDLSNDLFAAFLDETMTYSAALFEPGCTELAPAQRRKNEAVLDTAGVGPDSTVLEIGTGWGSLAIAAARRGARVTSLTVSEDQARLARRRVAQAGLADRVRVALCDYRCVQGRYDAVLSVEMIEAVGEKYWPTFFATLDRSLAPGGRVGLQAITIPHHRLLATRNSYTWIHKYVFPGGIIPSLRAIEDNLAAHTRLRVASRRDFGADYAETLRQWRQRFNAGAERIAELGFDETFRRMWEFYLAYCEAGFRAGYLGVSQFTLARW